MKPEKIFEEEAKSTRKDEFVLSCVVATIFILAVIVHIGVI